MLLHIIFILVNELMIYQPVSYCGDKSTDGPKDLDETWNTLLFGLLTANPHY
jgi:hypothetical protein